MENRKKTSILTVASIFSALAIVFTLVSIQTGLALAYPSWRLATEGLLVKLNGMWFGPFIGIASGVLTDGIVQLFYPVSLWFIPYMALTGAAAGLFKYLKNKHVNMELVNVIIGASAAVILFGYVLPKETVTVYGFELDRFFMILVTALVLGVLWLIGLVIYIIDIKNKTKIINVFLVVLVMDLVIDVPMISLANSETLSINIFDEMFIRFLTTPFKVVFNTIVLYVVYTNLLPILKRNMKNIGGNENDRIHTSDTTTEE